ncbi:hypothetical protein [Nocardia kruczakiae]|uniref:hypothetical protein n=1 Tax=Nocardia kruczakiae TaxID=261477 RepID=UPI0007A465E9|nr:hypothetical protein [Nocardia kruczakiae]
MGWFVGGHFVSPAGHAAAEFALDSPDSARTYSDRLHAWAEQKYDISRGRRRLRQQLNRTGLVTAEIPDPA